MAITEHFEPVVPQSTVLKTHRSRWRSAETYVLVVGLAAVVLLAFGRLVYEPSYQEKVAAARAALTTEQMSVCDKLGNPAGSPNRDKCMTLLNELEASYQRVMFADAGEI
jgi:hypothetical protein